MGFALSISLTAPFAVGDLLAECELADGTTARLALAGGCFFGELPALPVHLRLLYEAPESVAPRSTRESPPPGPSAQLVAEAEELFERGIRIPEDGRLHAQLIWGIHCHQTSASPSRVERFNNPTRSVGTKDEGTRFLSSEHVSCGLLIGKDADGQRLVVAGTRAPFHAKTLLPIGDKQATFGQILALAGDFYAYLDADAHRALPSAWPDPPPMVDFLTTDYRRPTLCEDAVENMQSILTIFSREAEQLAAGAKVDAISELYNDGTRTRFPTRRYLALASQNHCHFGAQPPDGSIDDTVEVFMHFCGSAPLADAQTAEALLPVVLAAGTAPQPGDVLPEGLGPTPQGGPNHFPLYALVRTGAGASEVIFARRVDAKNPHNNLYVEQDGKSGLRFPLPLPAP